MENKMLLLQNNKLKKQCKQLKKALSMACSTIITEEIDDIDICEAIETWKKENGCEDIEVSNQHLELYFIAKSKEIFKI